MALDNDDYIGDLMPESIMPRDQWDRERMVDGTFRVRCSNCGKSVSSPLVEPVIVRAWVQCPECIAAQRRDDE